MESLAQKLVKEFVARYGVSREINSDQGLNFESALFQGVCRLLHLDKTMTMPLRPQSNRMEELSNCTLQSMENQQYCHLPVLLMAYRSAVYETTDCMPSEMLGHELHLPLDLLYGHPEPDKSYGDATGYDDHLHDQLATLHQHA